LGDSHSENSNLVKKKDDRAGKKCSEGNELPSLLSKKNVGPKRPHPRKSSADARIFVEVGLRGGWPRALCIGKCSGGTKNTFSIKKRREQVAPFNGWKREAVLRRNHSPFITNRIDHSSCNSRGFCDSSG